MPDVQFVIPRATTVKPELIDHLMTMAQVPVKVVDAYRYNVRARWTWPSSPRARPRWRPGLLGTPMVIIYKVAYLSWLIGKNLVKIPYIGLINIVAGRHGRARTDPGAVHAAEHRRPLPEDPGRPARDRAGQVSARQGKEKMGGRGASRRAAEVVLAIAGTGRD